MKNKKFAKAIWEIRKKYNRAYLTKKQLREAYNLYAQAGENIKKFKELIKAI